MARDLSFDPLYQAYAAFRERCLLADRSLLWPELEVAHQGVWNIATLEEVRRRFVEGFIQGRMTFREKLDTQLSGAPAEAWALVADCFYIYGLPSRSIRFETRYGWVEWAARRAGLAVPPVDDPTWDPLRLGFAVTGQKYNLKHAQLRLLVLLALEVKASPERAQILSSPAEMQALLDGILDAIPLKIDRAYDMRNALLYLAFPDEYEPLISNRDKDAVIRHYAEGAGGVEGSGTEAGLGTAAVPPLPADRDAALRQVRRALAPRFTGLDRPFDFYLDVRGEWRAETGSAEGLERAIAGQADGPGGHAFRERGEEWPGPSHRDALPPVDPDIQRILQALRLTHNVILSGPPGTGKTYLAQKIARQLAGVSPETGRADPTGAQGARAHTPEQYIWWITLHPSYSYEDFVEGVRPRMPGGSRRGSALTQPVEGQGDQETAGPEARTSGAYEVRPGVFREVCERAFRDPRHTYVLVIDEINRANLAKILGELVTLIEDDKRGALSARLPYSGTRFTVPTNLVLLGTMNTADRSIALLDAALRRRFAFVEIQPRPELLAGALVETDEAVLRLDDLLRCLNAAISQQMGPGGLVGHSYFLRVARARPAERLDLLDLVWNTQVLPLLEEVFYARKERLAEVLAPFIDESGSPLTPGAEPFRFQNRPLNAGEPARLHGEDLVVALSRICDGESA